MKFSHVLISRPETDGAELGAALSNLGLTTVSIPSHGFEATGLQVRPDQAWKDAQHRLAVFTSPRAVRFGLRAAHPDYFSGAVLAAIGPATRAALERHGHVVGLQPESGFTSEDFLELQALRNTPGAATLFRAPGGRTALRDGLTALGWTVRPVAVYRRVALAPEPAAVKALESTGRLLSLWTSAAALEHLLVALPESAARDILDGLVVVPSARLAERAGTLGAKDVRVAGGADNESLLRAVRQAHGA